MISQTLSATLVVLLTSTYLLIHHISLYLSFPLHLSLSLFLSIPPSFPLHLSLCVFISLTFPFPDSRSLQISFLCFTSPASYASIFNRTSFFFSHVPSLLSLLITLLLPTFINIPNYFSLSLLFHLFQHFTGSLYTCLSSSSKSFTFFFSFFYKFFFFFFFFFSTVNILSYNYWLFRLSMFSPRQSSYEYLPLSVLLCQLLVSGLESAKHRWSVDVFYTHS